MHPLCGGALPLPYVSVWVTSGAVIAHQYTYASPSYRTSQYSKTFIPLPVSLCSDLIVTPYSMVWDWRVSRAGPMFFYWPSCKLSFCLLLFSLSLLSFYGLVLWGWGLRIDRSLPALYYQPFLIIKKATFLPVFFLMGNKLIGYADNSTVMLFCHAQALKLQ